MSDLNISNQSWPGKSPLAPIKTGRESPPRQAGEIDEVANKNISPWTPRRVGELAGRALLKPATRLTTAVSGVAIRALKLEAYVERRKQLAASDLKMRTPLFHESVLQSEWDSDELQEPLLGDQPPTPVTPVTPQPKTPAERKTLYKSLEAGQLSGAITSFLVSTVSFAIKIITSAASPLAPAIPFVGIFNGMANLALIGKGIDRMRFYRHLANELKEKRYDSNRKNFGPYSEITLANYPHLKGMDIAPNRLLRLLESEVNRKKIQYRFYLAARVLSVGAAIAGTIGGLAAFAVPVLGLPALLAGVPMAVMSLTLNIVGGRIANARMDPLLKKPSES